MKLVARTLLAAALTLSMSSAAMATYSGQIWIPSTDAKGFGEVNVSIDNYVRFSSSDNAGANTFDTGVTVGVLPFEKLKMEVGVDYLTDGGQGEDSDMSDNPIYFNAKVAVPEDAAFKGMPALAVGIFGMNAANTDLSANILYGLVAKTLPVVGRISAGGYHSSEHGMGSTSNDGAMLSWDRTMSEISDKLWMAVDYMSGKSAFGALSAGAAWAFTPNVSLLVGMNVYNPAQEDKPGGKPTFTTQLDINF